MPRSRNTRLRPKNTSRAEARRRHRDEQRELDAVDESADTNSETQAEEAPKQRSALAIPDFRGDFLALPRVFMKPLVWLPFGLLLLSAGLVLTWDSGVLPEGQVADIGSLYVQLTLPPTSLFVFFIGGFVATRASYMVGAILGAFDALLITILNEVAPEALAEVLTGRSDAIGAEQAGVSDAAQVWGIAIFVGIFSAGFAAWYRRFLRSSQARAAANRAAKEQEQAEKAKQQAREDKAAMRAQKQADRDARRK